MFTGLKAFLLGLSVVDKALEIWRNITRKKEREEQREAGRNEQKISNLEEEREASSNAARIDEAVDGMSDTELDSRLPVRDSGEAKPGS